MSMVTETRGSDVWCRACLSTNIRLHCIENPKLLEIYEKLTSTKLNTGDATLSTILCYICYSKLQRCCRFSDMISRSEKILRDLYHNEIEANKIVITTNLRSTHNLSVSTVYSTSVNVDDFDFETANDDYQYVKDEDITVKKEHGEEPSEGTSRFAEVQIQDIFQDILQPETTEIEDTVEYYCHLCNAGFDTEHKLLTHMQVHSDLPASSHNSYPCKKCPETFTCKCKLKKRGTRARTKVESKISQETKKIMATHTAEKPYTCNQCNKAFSDKACLIRHLRIHTGIKPYSCSKCNKNFIRESDLKTHMRMHTGEKPYTCTSCSKKFSMKHNLTRHMRTHTGEKPYSCTRCDKSFSEEGTLICHTRIHTGEKPYSCDRCSKGFIRLTDLKTHLRVHTGVKPYSCNVCSKAFSMKQHLNRHTRVHTGEKPYACDRCSKTLASLGDLRSHMRVHTGEKPYACSICDKTFAVKQNLTRHIRIHTGEKPYACDRCSKAFTGSSDLKSHLRIHTGEKPFSCLRCDKNFTERSSLTKHMRIHTGKNPFKLD